MKTHFFLMGISILMSVHTAQADDVRAGLPSVPNPEFADTLTLQEVTVRAVFSDSKNSPLRLSEVNSETIRSKAHVRTYPELLSGIPGLYATSESGSYGDAKMNIRGFSQENVSILLNGIPISGLVSGSMYWNNWMGLADATYAVQVQKGVGSSMLADGSVGGSVNIVTDSSGDSFSGEAGVCGSSFGTVKGYIKLDSGPLPRGWAVNLMASYVGGKGYVDATEVDSYAYMLNVSKRFGEEHSLIFTALGSPEKHGQRTTRLSIAEVESRGRTYSKNWGWKDGEAFSLSKNNYFKPYFTLRHIWDSERLTMRNSLYLAVASGGGRWSETKGTPISSFMSDGLIGWDAVLAANVAEDGSARNILTDYMAGHIQAGGIASAEYDLGSGWKIGGGLHGQYYSTWECERITDLLGADWWFENYEANSLASTAGRNPVKKVGDYVRTDNGKRTFHGTAYLTASYSSDKLNANIGLSGFGATTRRWDKYNYYGSDIWSAPASGLGASLKAGLLYKPSLSHSLYINGGWYSRLPYSSVWFSSGNNEITNGVRNERNILAEAGWRAVWNRGGLELTMYYAYWKNKSLMSSRYKPVDSDETRYMVTGLDALHYGVEAEVFQNVNKWLKLKAFASIGSWTWKNDVTAVIYDSYSGMEAGKVNAYCNGLPVGDSPQTQVGASIQADIPAGFRLSADWQFNDRMYADFDPLTRTNPDDRAPSYRFPSSHLLGATVSWTGNFRKKSSHPLSLTLFATGTNLLDTFYIERGKDGAGHDLESFRGYWGFGRTFSFGARFTFK